MHRFAALSWLMSLLVFTSCVSLDKPGSLVGCKSDPNGCIDNTPDAFGGSDSPKANRDSENTSDRSLGADGPSDASAALDVIAAPESDTASTSLLDASNDLTIVSQPDVPVDAANDSAADTPIVPAGACSPNGKLLPAGTICRAKVGPCDLVEVCNGVSSECPADKLAAADTICRIAAGDCDNAESCTGSSPACPADAFKSAGTVCRSNAGLCDVAESCSGTQAACPVDAFSPIGTICRKSTDGNHCDPAEACTGLSVACPGDLIYAPPPVPAGVLATPGPLQVTISWSAVAGATGYNVKASTVSGTGYTTRGTPPTSAASPYLDNGLIGGTPYYYVVSAINAISSCESGNSMQTSATPTGLCTPPAAPIVTSTAGDGQVSLAWPVSPGATSYSVARSTAMSTGYVSIASVKTGTGFVDLGVHNGTTYYYVVTASNGNCSSANSMEVSAAPTCTPPAVPANVVATPNNGSVALTWPAVAGADAYIVSRTTTSRADYTLIGATSTPSYTDTTVTNGVLYYYVVSSSSASSCTSLFSAEAAATPACTPPSVPTGLTATGGNGQIQLSWTASAGGPTSYEVLRGTTTGGPYQSLAKPSATSYTDSTAANGTPYYYVVKSVVTSSNGSCASLTSAETSATANCTPPPIPSALAVTPGNAQVALVWNASSGATSYLVSRSTQNGGPYTALAPAPAIASFTNTNLTNDTTYYYVVSASNGTCRSLNSAQVSATPATCVQAEPTHVAATPGSQQVTLTWTAASGATSYGIARSTTKGSGYLSVGTAPASPFVDSDITLVNGTTYYYVITANGTCTSPPSAEVSVTPVCTPPAVPSGVTAKADSTNGQITVSWSIVANATAYTVARGTALSGPFSKISTKQTAATYTDTVGLAAGTTYYYVISASNAEDTCASATSAPAVFATSCASPVAPIGLTATTGIGQVTLTWTASTGATGYTVSRSTTSGTGFTLLTKTTAATYVDATVTNDTTYYYVVTASNGDGACVTNPSAQAAATPRACLVHKGGPALISFDTASAFCFTTCDTIAGWGCSNFDGRTVSVNGQVATCGGALPTPVKGAYTFQSTAGAYPWAAIFWWGTGNDCAP